MHRRSNATKKDVLLIFEWLWSQKINHRRVENSKKSTNRDGTWADEKDGTYVHRGSVGSQYPARGEMIREHRYWVSFCRRFLVSRIVQWGLRTSRRRPPRSRLDSHGDQFHYFSKTKEWDISSTLSSRTRRVSDRRITWLMIPRNGWCIAGDVT